MLHKSVDAFSVMTYDAAHPARPGFNAPLPWVENNIRLLLDAEHAAAQKEDKTAKPCAPPGLSCLGVDLVMDTIHHGRVPGVNEACVVL